MVYNLPKTADGALPVTPCKIVLYSEIALSLVLFYNNLTRKCVCFYVTVLLEKSKTAAGTQSII